MKLINLDPNAVWLFASTTAMGAMGIMDFMEEEEGEDGGSSGGGGGGDDDLFDDDMDDGFGGMDDGGGGGGMDDGMGDWADGGGDDDGFGDMGGGAATQELENRVEDLENEVGDISSTMSTVRSENEQISEKVDDVEENVRKLLEIYEMVTRGVNPFVDDVQGGGPGGDAFPGGGEQGGSDFGLFDDDEEEEESEEELEGDVADAEAESFFEEDFDDMEGDEEDEFDDFEDEDEFGDDDLDNMDGDEAMDDVDDESGQAGGSTFQELKDEYESGEADWAEDAEGSPEPGQEESVDAGAEMEMDPEPEMDADSGPEMEMDPDPVAAESADEATENAEDESEFEFQEPEETAEPAGEAQQGVAKPYLTDLPSGYVVDLVVMEWVEFLVDEFGPEEALHTISYYEDIDWISESVEEDLLTFVDGIVDVADVEADGAAPATLGVEDHIQSLTFMTQLTGDAIEQKVVDHCVQLRGEGHGLQR
jgi:flagellar protein FlaE/flagellar protein FlaC